MAQSGACTALEKSMLYSVLVLGSTVRRGLTKTGSCSPSEATPTARTARAPSETARTFPTRGACLDLAKSHEEVAHLFCIAHPTVVFIILPLPERPGNTLTSTLTLSGSFFKHLTGDWFRNRFALSCVFVLCASACFFPIREESCASFSSIVLCPVLRPAIPVFSLHLLTVPSLYSLNSAICAFHSPTRKTPRVYSVPLRTVFFFVLLSTIVDLLCLRPSLFVYPCLTSRCILPTDV